jgi:hypothetical protein
MDYNKYSQPLTSSAVPASASAAPPAGANPMAPTDGQKVRRPINVFGPLKKKYCFYFYILEVFGFVLFLSILVYIVYRLVTSKKDTPYMTLGLTSLVYFVFYFQNRLLYNMCLNSNLGG